MQQEEGRVANRILDIVYQRAAPDAVVMHLNLAAFVGRGDIDPVENLFQAAVDIGKKYRARLISPWRFGPTDPPRSTTESGSIVIARWNMAFRSMTNYPTPPTLAVLGHIEARLGDLSA